MIFFTIKINFSSTFRINENYTLLYPTFCGTFRKLLLSTLVGSKEPNDRCYHTICLQSCVSKVNMLIAGRKEIKFSANRHPKCARWFSSLGCLRDPSSVTPASQGQGYSRWYARRYGVNGMCVRKRN